MGKLKTKYPMCPVCAPHERLENIVGDGVFTREDVPPWLTTPRDVDTYPGRSHETNARHVMTWDNILAKYDFRGNAWRTHCCLGHPHAQGLIVKTHCGLVLAIGEKCAEDSIAGLRGAIKRMHAATEYFASIRAIDRIIAELPGLLPCEKEATELADFKRAFGTSLGHVANALRDDSAKAASFAGARALWAERTPDIAGLHARFKELRKQRAALEGAPARIVRKASRDFGTLDASARNARRWFDAAKGFASHDNLRSIVQAFGVGATVRDGVITMAGPTDKRHRHVQLGLGVYGLSLPANKS